MKKGTIDVAAAVIIHKNQVLLARRRGGYLDNLWEFPGGKLEEDETAQHAAKRELVEELDISVTPGHTMLILEHEYPDKNVRLHFVKCHLLDTPDICLRKTQSNPEVGWFSPEDLPLNEFCPADKIAVGHIPWKQILNARK